MAEVIVYHHDPVEVDPATSWTGLCEPLAGAAYVDIVNATDDAVIDLFAYARPDAVITVDGRPVVSLEQTQMNPSGHNIPQRYSCLVRAAELGVPSILYYPEKSRRTFSDPNVRYAQVRVPLAQNRMSHTYGVPSLSVFWPMDPESLLPSTTQADHQPIADTIGELIEAPAGADLLALPAVTNAISEMDRVVKEYASRYRRNSSVRGYLPNGFPSAVVESTGSIDPPGKVTMTETADFLDSLEGVFREGSDWGATRAHLLRRDHTLVFAGTTNQAGTDSEHPWPGYLTLIDVLYARSNGGQSPGDREYNLVYEVPILIDTYVNRANQATPPTATFIVDSFADLLVLQGGAVAGRPSRGIADAEAGLIR